MQRARDRDQLLEAGMGVAQIKACLCKLNPAGYEDSMALI
jgi:hypothetical protein